MMRGLGRFHLSSRKAASVLGSPSRTASDATPFTSLRYHAQRIGDPVESVSGDLWPKTSVVMMRVLSDRECFGAPYRRVRGVCHPAMLHCGKGGWCLSLAVSPSGLIRGAPDQEILWSSQRMTGTEAQASGSQQVGRDSLGLEWTLT